MKRSTIAVIIATGLILAAIIPAGPIIGAGAAPLALPSLIFGFTLIFIAIGLKLFKSEK